MEPLPDDLVELELPDDLQDVGSSPPENMSVGQPANINVPPEQPGFASQALTFAQDYSKAHLRGVLGVPPADARDAYFNAISNTPNINAVIPDALVIPAARALQGANPLIGGEAGEKVFETPQGHKAGLDFQRGMEDTPGARAVGAVFGQQARNRTADIAGGTLQGIAGALPSALPVVGGVNLSGKFAAKLAPNFPKLAGFILGSAETSGQMLVTSVLGAEQGERLATLEALLSAPQTWEDYALKVGLPLAGGFGAAIGAKQLATQRARAQVNQAAKVGVADAYVSALELSHDVAESRAQYRHQVAAIVSRDHVRAIADDMEMKAAQAKGEMLAGQPVKKPTLALDAEAPFKAKKALVGFHADESQYAVVGGEKGGAHYQFERDVSEPDMDFTAEGAGMGVREDPNVRLPFPGKEGVRPEAQMLPLTKRDVRVEAGKKASATKAAKKASAQQAAIVAAPDAKKGLAGVIEYSDGRVEVQNINNVTDAAKFQKKVSEGKRKVEVGVSTRAEGILSKEPDVDLHDTLVLSVQERANGKTTGGAAGGSRDAVLVFEGPTSISHELPYLAKLSDPAVKAEALARSSRIVAIRTKSGPAFVRILGDDGDAILAQSLTPEHGLPTITDDVIRLPKADPHFTMPTREDWFNYFTDNKLPPNLNKVKMASANASYNLNVSNAAPKPVQVLKFDKPEGPSTRPQRSLEGVEILPSSLLEDLDPVGSIVAPVGPEDLARYAAGGPKVAAIDVSSWPVNKIQRVYGVGHDRAVLIKQGGWINPPPGGGSGNGGGGGLPPRPPKPPSGPPEPPPQFPAGPVDPKRLPDHVLNAVRALRDLNLNDPNQMNIWRRAGRVLVGQHLRGPIDLRTHLMMLKNAEGMAHLRERALFALQKAAPGAPRSDINFQADTVKVGKGLMTTDELVAKYPAVKAAKQIYDDLMREGKADEQWLLNENMLNPRMDTLAESPEYLTRLSLAYMMKGKKALQFSKALEGGKVWEDAITGVIDDHQARGNVIDKVQAEVYLRDLLGGDDPIATWNGAAGAGNAKARKNLPGWLSKVLGQDLAGELAMAHRLAVQKSAVARGTVFKEMAARPDWVSPQPMDATWKRIPNSRWLYGDLSNQFVHPHIYDSIIPDKEWGTLAAKQHNIARQPNELYAFFRRLGGIIKGNEVANPATIFNSFMGNWTHMALAGISPAEFPRYGMNMAKALRAASDYKKNPLAQDGLAYIIRDARRVGFDAEGFGSADMYKGEISGLQQTFLDAAKKANVGSHPWEGVLNGFKAVIRAPGKFTEKMGAVLDLTDRIHKVAAGYTLAEQALRRAKNGERGFAGVINSREDAMRWAARRVNDAFPMPDRIGLYPKYMTDAAGAVNPYSTFMTEYIRTHLGTPARIAEDPRIAISLASWGVVASGLMAAYSAHNPVEKKLIEEERKTRTQGTMTYEPATVPLYIESSNGRPILADATPMFEVLKYLNGDPTLNVAERVAGNFVINMTDRGILGTPIQAGMERLDPRWEQHERKRRLWDTGAGAALDWVLMDSGLVPKLPGKLYRQWASTQPVPLNLYSPMQQQPPEIAAMRAAGLPILPQVNPLAKPLGMALQQGQMKKDIKTRLMEPEGFSRPGPLSGIGKDTGEDIQSIIEHRMRQK